MAESTKKASGEGGIRTLGIREDTPVFETGPFGHSGTSPAMGCRWLGGGREIAWGVYRSLRDVTTGPACGFGGVW